MKGVRLKRSDVERFLRLHREYVDHDYRFIYEGDTVIIPIKEVPPGEWEVVNASFEKRMRKPTLHDLLPPLERFSMDVIGDIAIIDVSERPEEVARIILDTMPNIKAVYKKVGGLRGAYRVRNLEWLAGERRTLTIHVEHGCRFYVDVAKVYFSPRLSHERGRLASLVKEGENVLVPFSGVGPFPIVMAKARKVRTVGIELNPDAHELAVKNARINKLRGSFEPILGDVRDVLESGRFDEWADRVVMPLPWDSIEFIPVMLRACRLPCTFHVYTFLRRGTDEEVGRRIMDLMRERGDPHIVFSRKVRTYSPEEEQYVYDVLLL